MDGSGIPIGMAPLAGDLAIVHLAMEPNQAPLGAIPNQFGHIDRCARVTMKSVEEGQFGRLAHKIASAVCFSRRTASATFATAQSTLIVQPTK